MFKQTTISKKVTAGIVAGLILGSFSPVQAYSMKDAKRDAKVTVRTTLRAITPPLKVCFNCAIVTSGAIASLIGFEAILESLMDFTDILNKHKELPELLLPQMKEMSCQLRKDPKILLLPIGIGLIIWGAKRFKNQFWDKQKQDYNEEEWKKYIV